MKLFITDHKKLHIEEKYNSFMEVFSEETRAGITRFKFEEGRYMALLRQLLTENVLKSNIDKTPDTLCLSTTLMPPLFYEKNENGKPYLSPAGSGPEFNISHSGTKVVLAVGSHPLGVDIERTDRVKDYRKLLRFFYPFERERILSAPDPEDEFCRVWTYREAVSKMAGVGLTLFEKEMIDTDYDAGRVSCHGHDYIFYEIPVPGYRLTLCAEASEEPPAVYIADKISYKKAAPEDRGLLQITYIKTCSMTYGCFLPNLL